MTDRHVIIDRLEKLFSDTFHVDIPDPDADLLDQGVLDSFQFVELLMQLEQDFGFELDIQQIDLDDLRTLRRIAQLVDSHGISVNGGDPGAGRDARI